MILSQAIAKAVYDAMCALNNVGGTLDARIGAIHVYERASGHVHVEALAQGLSDEIHADQAAFAAAYSL